jgi:PAS domain S-box-containing protein
MSTARALSAAVDVKLKTGAAALAALSTSQALRAADLSHFYERCVETARQHNAWIILADTSGQPIFNTRIPLGTSLAHLQMTDLVRAAVETRAVQVSGIFTGGMTGRYQVSIIVPVVWPDQVTRVLIMSFEPEEIGRVLQDERLPESWTLAVADRNGLIIAHNHTLNESPGTPLGTVYTEKMAGVSEAAFTGTGREGLITQSALSKSDFSGWTLLVGMPVSEINGPLRHSLLGMGLAAGAMLLLGVAVASWVGSRLNRSAGRLSSAALALAHGGVTPLTPFRTKVVEINDVMSSLGKASDNLLRRLRQRDQAEASLRESEARLERAQEIAGIGSWELDLSTGHHFWSKEMYRIRGLSPDSFDPTMTRISEYVHEEDWPQVQAWIDGLKSGAEQDSIEYRTHRPDGEWRIVSVEGKAVTDAAGAITKVAGTMRDITELRHAEQERRKLEQQLQHSQKLEALGVLAGGIAHDLNNTLVPIFVTAKLGIKQAPEGSRLRQNFELIYQSGARARDLIKRILAFSRKDAIDRRGFRLDQIISDDLAMLRAGIPSTITIETDIRPVPETFGDPDQMHQVVVNLVTNAVQAVGNGLGTVKISLAAVIQSGVEENQIIRLEVRDTGCGMDEATMGRIFEPFYTTKGVGEGTGLGLSMVHGIVTSHGGTIHVESEPGKGSCFTIELPTAAGANEEEVATNRRLNGVQAAPV